MTKLQIRRGSGFLAAGCGRRLARLLDSPDGFAVIVAMDHGIAGFVNGLRNPREVLAKAIVENPDGILFNAGLARRLINDLSARDSPSLIVALDQVMHAGVRGSGPAVGHGPQASVEEAIRLGADAVKTMLVVGFVDRAAELANLRYLAKTAEECQRWEMPLIIEPYLWGEAVPVDPQDRGEIGADGARKAIEMGADILKIEYSGDAELFEDIVCSAPIPVVVLGGPRRPTQREVLEDIVIVARAGAVGIAMGRNIWDQPDPATMIRAIRIAVQDSDLDAAVAHLARPDAASY